MTPTVLITGASRGIGLEVVRQYLARGARVLAVHRPGPVVPEALASLQAGHSDRMRLIALDLGAASSVANLSARPSERIDILVNNTGLLMESSVVPNGNLVGGAFRPTFHVNAIAPLFVARAALSNMTRGGKIATILPIRDVQNLDLLDPDARQAAKAAVIKVMQSLATDLRPAGVSVALIHPGAVGPVGGADFGPSLMESARGIVTVVENLSLENSGRFFSYDGTATED